MEGTPVSVDDFQFICRCCLCDCKNLVSFNLNDTFILKDVIGDILSRCASIHVSKEDTLPKQVCQQCLNDLTNCYTFIDKCQKSESALMAVLNQNETIIKTEEIELHLHEIKQEDLYLSDLEIEVLDTSDCLPKPPKTSPKQCHEKSCTCEHCGVDKRKPGASFKCGFCDMIFARKGNQLRHEKTHTGEKPYKCTLCEKSFTRKERCITHARIHTQEKPYKCSFCEKAFKQRGGLIIHERRHTGEKPYICGLCDKGFVTKADQVSHEVLRKCEKPTFCEQPLKRTTEPPVREKKTHAEEKPFECSSCEKSFARKAHLVTHELIHRGEKPYSCGFCEKTFLRKVEQIVHERTHTGEKPYKCDFCDRNFTTKSDQIRHTRVHTGETPFKCGFCEKAFKQRIEVVFHERTHTGERPHKCGFCGRGFAKKVHQVRHERIHTGEKPYKCSFCEKGFSSKRDQDSHERIHTGEKPFRCDDCDRCFRDKSLLRKHCKKCSSVKKQTKQEEIFVEQSI